MIYLDNAAGSPVLSCSLKAFMDAPEGNPNSGHIAGIEARKALELARETISECVGCLPEEVHFVSCASEAAAWAMQTLRDECSELYRSPFEHHCIADWCGITENKFHYYEHGYANILVGNETGEIFNPMEGFYADRFLCLTDATAGVGHIIVNFSELGVDYLIGDAMKFGGIPGCGFLVVKKGAPLAWHPLGTPPVKLICAMAAALKWQTDRMGENLEYTHRLNLKMLWTLGDKFKPTLGAKVLDASPYILSGRFDGVPAEALVAAASAQGVCISAGAACSTGNLEASPALLASGLREEEAMQTVRISFSHENTFAEIEEAGKIIRECAKMMGGI